MGTETFGSYILYLFTSHFASKFVACVFLKIIVHAWNIALKNTE